MSKPQKDPKLPPELEKRYGSYKVSEFTHGKEGYKLETPTESDILHSQSEVPQTIDFDLSEDGLPNDYRKRYTLSEKKDKSNQQVSLKDSIKELSPFQWK